MAQSIDSSSHSGDSSTCSSNTSSSSNYKDPEDKKEINSFAIVKSPQIDKPTSYSTLEKHTDLKLAPSNWLRGNLAGRFNAWSYRKHEPINFSSLNMAHRFLETLEKVDVISDSENIKKLLKLPYSKAHVSLAVHRIGKTLLLDTFDVERFLASTTPQSQDDVDFKWLQDIYRQEANIETENAFARQRKRNTRLQRSNNIFSKFLYHSIKDSSQHENVASGPHSDVEGGTESSSMVPEMTPQLENIQQPSDEGTQLQIQRQDSQELVPYINILDTFLPDPKPEHKPSTSFQRNVLWEFEDIHMLIGSNMPIFGGGKFPAVSLRLRDCSDPINILTGLDFWLDNLMCNVPEVVMCYHLDGIVQHYELVKTEELPNLEGGQFSPQVIKDIAQNVLSFLKSNCTKEGHTYWLFRDSGSEVVKLYDLTSLWSQNSNDKTQNPFTTPVGILLFRVAKNLMQQTKPMSSSEKSTIHTLLKQCLLLLDEDNHPEIVSSANYLLSDLYVPDHVHISSSIIQSLDDISNEETDSSTVQQPQEPGVKDVVCKFLDATTLTIPGMHFQDEYERLPLPLPCSITKRCKEALAAIVKGLACSEQLQKKKSSIPNDGKPIPLPYTDTPPESLRSFNEGKDDSKVLNTNLWETKSQSLFLHKAAGVYYSLSRIWNSQGKHGRALRYIKQCLKCMHAFCSLTGVVEESALLPAAMCVAGDAYMLLARSGENFESHQKDFVYMSPEERKINDFAGDCQINGKGTYELKVEFSPCVEKNLLLSLSLYESAIDMMPQNSAVEQLIYLTKRMGNSRNELGVFYMKTAASLVGQEESVSEKEQELWKKSISYFEGGIRAFEAVDDCANIALLYSNTGRLMRLCAQACRGRGLQSKKEFSQQEKLYFNKAIDYYSKALQCIGERAKCSVAWDTVTWELSGAYFTMATLLQDYVPLSTQTQDQVEKEVADLMMKALKHCEGAVTNIHTKDLITQRMGTIHHRLASLYHNAFRDNGSDHNYKKTRNLAELHYTKAHSYLSPDKFPCAFIRIQLEHVALNEFQINQHGGAHNAPKLLQTSLDCLLETKQALEVCEIELCQGLDPKSQSFENQQVSSNSEEDSTAQELKSLLPILESRLKNVLKDMTKYSTQRRGKITEHESANLNILKQMYMVALRGTSQTGSLDRLEDITKKCTQLVGVLSDLNQLKQERDNQ